MTTSTLHLVSAIVVVIAVGAWVLMAMLYAWRSERAVREALDLNERMWRHNEEVMATLTRVMDAIAKQKAEATHEQ